jgi:hypothetical protein
MTATTTAAPMAQLKRIGKSLFNKLQRLANPKAKSSNKNNKIACEWVFGKEDAHHVSAIIDRYYKGLWSRDPSFLERKSNPEMIINKIIRKRVQTHVTIDKVCVYKYTSKSGLFKFDHYHYCITNWNTDGLPDKVEFATEQEFYNINNAAHSTTYLYALPISSACARQFEYSASDKDQKVRFADKQVSEFMKIATGNDIKPSYKKRKDKRIRELEDEVD